MLHRARHHIAAEVIPLVFTLAGATENRRDLLRCCLCQRYFFGASTVTRSTS